MRENDRERTGSAPIGPRKNRRSLLSKSGDKQEMPDFRILSTAGAAPNFRTLQFLQAGWGVLLAEIVFDVLRRMDFKIANWRSET